MGEQSFCPLIKGNCRKDCAWAYYLRDDGTVVCFFTKTDKDESDKEMEFIDATKPI